MRPLTDTETKTLFEKLANYTGRSLNNQLTDTAPAPGGKAQPDRYVFRVQKDRVYYVRESLANLATSVAREALLSLGTCLGKFTKTGKFRMHITSLDVIAPHARYKVWVKANGEMPFLYGGHVVKAHVGRWSEDCPEHQGVVVLSMNDTPLVSWRCMWKNCLGMITNGFTRASALPLARPLKEGDSTRLVSSCSDKPTAASTSATKTRFSQPKRVYPRKFGSPPRTR
jgi:60S ribosome subunit biogenesis protein NIP7